MILEMKYKTKLRKMGASLLTKLILNFEMIKQNMLYGRRALIQNKWMTMNHYQWLEFDMSKWISESERGQLT